MAEAVLEGRHLDRFPQAAPKGARPKGQVTRTSIAHVRDNPWQPRLRIRDEELRDLVESIREHGFSGHLEVRHDPADAQAPFQLVFGHRRLRAAQLAGMSVIPVEIVERSDEQMRSLAFIENHTHLKPTPWEEGVWMDRLMREHGYSLRSLARLLGVDKGYVENRLKLLQLPADSPLRQAAEQGSVFLSTATAFVSVKPLLDEAEAVTLEQAAAEGVVKGVDLYRIGRNRREERREAGAGRQEARPEPTADRLAGTPPDIEALARSIPLPETAAPLERLLAEARRQDLRSTRPVDLPARLEVVPDSYRTNSMVITPRETAAAAIHRTLGDFLIHLRPRVFRVDWADLDETQRKEVRAWRDELTELLLDA